MGMGERIIAYLFLCSFAGIKPFDPKKDMGAKVIQWDKGDISWGLDINECPEMWSDIGVTRVSGSHLPRHSDSQVCCITNQIIKGSSYFLENGESVMGLNDALMWAKVHPYSPLGTGHRLSPF
ncbi:WD repeat-containing protein 17 [Halocaridina rubra]|uniref:WD repeat-containing protein 17 n=1 Tax=Halocaridina rubra TaxID=373956 RepID=A0AAN8X9V5_HALRR